MIIDLKTRNKLADTWKVIFNDPVNNLIVRLPQHVDAVTAFRVIRTRHKLARRVVAVTKPASV